jgi:hypothetical protein
MCADAVDIGDTIHPHLTLGETAQVQLVVEATDSNLGYLVASYTERILAPLRPSTGRCAPWLRRCPRCGRGANVSPKNVLLGRARRRGAQCCLVVRSFELHG